MTFPASWSPHHTSPESDPQALRAELDGCRAEIEAYRELLRWLDWSTFDDSRIAEIVNGPTVPSASPGAHWTLVAHPDQERLAALFKAALVASPVLGENGEGT